MRQLDPEHRCLNRVEPEVAADALVKVARLGAVVPEQANLVRELLVVRRDEPAIAEPAEVLAGEEREAADMADRARLASFVGGANRLAGIFDDRNARFA